MRVRAVFFLAAFALILSAFAPAAQAAQAKPAENWPTHLRMLTGPNGGQWFMMGDPIAQALTRHVLPSASRMGGGVANIASISTGQGDLGFTLACFMGAAQSGAPEYASINLSNAVLMANIYPQVLYILIREDFAQKHGIDSVETLLSKNIPLRFASLRPGTASEFILSLLLKHGYGKNFDDLRAQGWSVYFNNYAETADNFVAGELDCFAYTAGTEVPLILTMEEHTGVRVLPVEQRVLDLLSEKFATSTYTIKPGVYKSVPEPIRTLGDYTSIVVRKDLPEDLVYAICEALWLERGVIASVISDFGQIAPQTALPENLDVHPGAARFWKSLIH